MYQIEQLRIPIDELAALPDVQACTPPDALLLRRACALLRLRPESVAGIRIRRRSLDFRRGHTPAMVFAVDVYETGEAGEWAAQAERDTQAAPLRPCPTPSQLSRRPQPVVVGCGPAGLFCALTLAQGGLRPLVLERGETVEVRAAAVHRFWDRTEPPDPENNVQFGEGGAGTFSDGKLTTLIRDRDRLGRAVLEAFVRAGAPEDILVQAKPHIGTDRLQSVVVRLRKAVEAAGGTFRFGARVTGLDTEAGRLTAVHYRDRDGTAHTQPADAAFFCIGHSARDTFPMLLESGVRMTRKAFSVGFRIEHPQAWLNQVQYGRYAAFLGPQFPADYKLSRAADAARGIGRGVYTFCMCPGGYVVNAASEPGGVVTNGMSDCARSGENANAAVLVSVTPADFEPYASGADDVLAGMRFQRALEEKAFLLGGSDYSLPAQRLGDFLEGPLPRSRFGRSGGAFRAQTRGRIHFTALNTLLPPDLTHALRDGLLALDGKMRGFADPEAILTGVESRTSSPVCILRDPDTMESAVRGLYPLGEGAGHAGGIMSSAIDGIRGANAFLRTKG